MNIWHDISASRITPEDFIACIEISKGGKNKYELDKETGMLILDRVLYTATHYPANYGFIPRTYAGDGDPLDVLVLCQESILPLTLVRCYPIGVITMLDQGKLDEKIIAIPFKDPTYNSYHDVSELPSHIFTEMSHFFTVYKNLEQKETMVDEVRGAEDAKKVIQKCLNVITEKCVLFNFDYALFNICPFGLSCRVEVAALQDIDPGCESIIIFCKKVCCCLSSRKESFKYHVISVTFVIIEEVEEFGDGSFSRFDLQRSHL